MRWHSPEETPPMKKPIIISERGTFHIVQVEIAAGSYMFFEESSGRYYMIRDVVSWATIPECES